MHKFVSVLLLLVGFVAACDKPVGAGAPVAAVPLDPWIAPQGVSEPAAEIFASCASCHMSDGSGRVDGTVPRLAGQRVAVLVHKLHKLQSGAVTLPVMVPYARSLASYEVSAVAQYLAALPVPEYASVATAGENLYKTYCAGCHGDAAEGSDVWLAPRLCGQHQQYIERRMLEILNNSRGDADAAMVAVVQALPAEHGEAIAAWLGQGVCTKAVATP